MLTNRKFLLGTRINEREKWSQIRSEFVDLSPRLSYHWNSYQNLQIYIEPNWYPPDLLSGRSNVGWIESSVEPQNSYRNCLLKQLHGNYSINAHLSSINHVLCIADSVISSRSSNHEMNVCRQTSPNVTEKICLQMLKKSAVQLN